jgi:hypothetical protein
MKIKYEINFFENVLIFFHVFNNVHYCHRIRVFIPGSDVLFDGDSLEPCQYFPDP